MSKRNPQLRFIVLLVVLVAVVVPLSTVMADTSTPVGDDRPATVMSRNLYLGADLAPIFQAIPTGNPELIGAAVFEVYGNALNSNIPGRAKAIAQEIASNQPELVGLQEVVVWTGPAGTVDYLQFLLAELEAAGASYEAIAVSEGFAFALPIDANTTIGLEISDVILARTDLPTSRLKLSNIQTGQYVARVIFPFLDGYPDQHPQTVGVSGC